MRTIESLKYVNAPLISGIQSRFSRFINVRPVNQSHSNILRWANFSLERRDGYIPKNFSNIYKPDGNLGWLDDNLAGGEITDFITVDGIEYYMWISNDKTKQRIYRSIDGCKLYQIHEDCFCLGGFEYFMRTTFVKGKPKKIYDRVPNGPLDSIAGIEGIQENASSGGETEGSLQDYRNTEFNYQFYYNQGNDSILPGDIVYAYSRHSTSVEGDLGICGQINEVAGISEDNKTLYMNAPWAGIDEKGVGIEWMVFGDEGDTFSFQTCSGVKTFHYYENGYNDNLAVVTSTCNFQNCYQDGVLYTGANGANHAVYLDKNRSIVLYSNPGQLGYLGSGNVVKTRSGVIAMTTFQDYVTYFGEDYIGAFYITQQADSITGTPVNTAIGNIVRKNLGIWKNSNGRGEAFDEYNNSFYFMGSNKRLYALSMQSGKNGKIESQLTDMTDEAWAKYIIGDLEEIQKGDDVYIQGDDDKFTIFINGSNNNNGENHKTKILRYWKRRQIRTIDEICCGVIKKRVKGLYQDMYLGNYTYIECGDTDCNNIPVAGEIVSHLFEDGVNEEETSFTKKGLHWIEHRIDTEYKKLQGIELKLTGMGDGYSTEFVVTNRNRNWRIDSLDKINNGQAIKPTVCMLQQMKGCQTLKLQDCKGEENIDYQSDLFYKYNIKEGETLDCYCKPKKQIDNYCYCYDNKKYFLSPFNIIRTPLNNIEGYVFNYSFKFYDRLKYSGFVMSYFPEEIGKSITECNQLGCEDCDGNNDKHTRCVSLPHYGC